MSTPTITPTRLSLGPWLMFGVRQMGVDVRQRWYLFAVVGLIWFLALIRLFVWWRDKRLAGGIGWGFAALEVAGCALVVATAYYGGQLVYTLGVNVAHAAQ